MLSDHTEPVTYERMRSLSDKKRAIHLANICLDGSLAENYTLGVELCVYIIIIFYSIIVSTYNHIIQAGGAACGSESTEARQGTHLIGRRTHLRYVYVFGTKSQELIRLKQRLI